MNEQGKIRTTNDGNARDVACAFDVLRLSCFLLLLFMLTHACNANAATDLAAPDAAVEAGRSALRSQSSTPWYDRDADEYGPINLPPSRRGWDWSWLDDLFSGFGSLSGLGEVMKFLMWLLIAALLVWIVVAMLRAWRQNEIQQVNASAEATTSGEHISRVEALPVAIEKPMSNLLAEAKRLAGLGDYRQAIVYLFSHQLVEADTAGALRLRKGKTNRQYLRELRRNRTRQPELPPLLERTMLVFERAFFGNHEPTRKHFDRCLAAAERYDTLLRTDPQGEAA